MVSVDKGRTGPCVRFLLYMYMYFKVQVSETANSDLDYYVLWCRGIMWAKYLAIVVLDEIHDVVAALIFFKNTCESSVFISNCNGGRSA